MKFEVREKGSQLDAPVCYVSSRYVTDVSQAVQQMAPRSVYLKLPQCMVMQINVVSTVKQNSNTAMSNQLHDLWTGKLAYLKREAYKFSATALTSTQTSKLNRHIKFQTSA